VSTSKKVNDLFTDKRVGIISNGDSIKIYNIATIHNTTVLFMTNYFIIIGFVMVGNNEYVRVELTVNVVA